MPVEALPDLSVVIPVYNEAHCIAESIRRVAVFLSLKGKPWELVIVSDGSTDKTDEIVAAIAAQNPSVRFLISPKNMGKGATVRRGVLAARGQKILVSDADLASPIKEVEKLSAALDEGFDAAIGSRALKAPGRDVQQSPLRAISGRIFNFFVQLLFLKGFLDTQCGFKLFRREAAQAVFSAQKLDGFCFDVEALYLALQKGFKVKEVPVMWRPGEKSQVRLLRDSARMIRELFILRKLYR